MISGAVSGARAVTHAVLALLAVRPSQGGVPTTPQSKCATGLEQWPVKVNGGGRQCGGAHAVGCSRFSQRRSCIGAAHAHMGQTCCHCSSTTVKLASSADGAASSATIAEQPHVEIAVEELGQVAKHPGEEHTEPVHWAVASEPAPGAAQEDCARAKKAEHMLPPMRSIGAGAHSSAGTTAVAEGRDSSSKGSLKVATIQPAPIMDDTNNETANTAPIHIQAMVGLVAMQVIIDTGSGHSFICKDTLSNIKVFGQRPVLRPWQYRRPLGIGRGTLDVVASTVLQLRIGGAQAAVRFAVVQGQVPTLVGNNAL